MYRKILLVIVSLLFTIGMLSADDLNPVEQLGKEIYFDKISSPERQACASCHAPEVGFTGPTPGINLISAVYPGAVPTRFGNRKPPSAAYATQSPIFYFDEEEGLFLGGNFWDGRATGETLGNPSAEQALGPFLNPVEQNMPDKESVLMHIAESKYASLWADVWGEPISCETPEDVERNYDRVGLSIAAFEASPEVNQFSSKYDYYLAGQVELSEAEALGLELFNGKGMCADCHPSEPGPYSVHALFTDYSFDNLGTPKNPDNPFYDVDPDFVDPGLGGFLMNHPNPDWAAMYEENLGKHKVPTLRNVAKAPSDKFIKAYMHNGVFKSLEEVVHFYNTRDVGDWPPPEEPLNVNTDELGDLGLTAEEEALIVTFMKTLSDGYDLKKDKVKDKTEEATFSITGANPFNPSTQFTYSLPQAADVQIHVYNTLGQRVATILNSHQPAGTYQVHFDASHLSSGIYFVHLTAQDKILTQKISLIK